jgi:hypothetical protein
MFAAYLHVQHMSIKAPAFELNSCPANGAFALQNYSCVVSDDLRHGLTDQESVRALQHSPDISCWLIAS